MKQNYSDTDEYKRNHFIRVIEHAVEQMSIRELEGVAYDLFTKGYLEEY